MTNITIVSAFICINNSNRSIDKYIELGKILLKSNVNKIIFIDESIIDKFKKYNNANTYIIPFKKENIYLYDYINKITNFQLNTITPGKDTIEYMFINIYKTEWLRMAIENNKYNTEQFIWIDFGIKHMFTDNETNFLNKLERLNNSNYNHIRIASIWNVNSNTNKDKYKDILWYFAGSVIGGSAKLLIPFADLVKNETLTIINTYNTIMWEVNIWYLVYINNKELFEPYYCNHDSSIIDNY